MVYVPLNSKYKVIRRRDSSEGRGKPGIKLTALFVLHYASGLTMHVVYASHLICVSVFTDTSIGYELMKEMFVMIRPEF